MGISNFWILLAVASALTSCKADTITNWPSFMQRLRREVVDLHSGEFCVDVSTYGLVKFEAAPREKCDTVFNKQCETKTEQVCDEVTEIQCEIVPYTECSMSMEATPYKSFEMVPKIFKKKICREGMDVVQHTKMMPECRNVTKQNCITKWETDAEGNQVWAGNEACEPVTWRECKLVPRQVDFKVPKIECDEGEEIPYTDCEDAEKSQMTTKMTCEVKHTTNCKPIASTKCQNINYQECAELPEEKCETIEMKVPTQEKEHKKKCLLPDDGSALATPRGGANRAASVPQQLDSADAEAKPQDLDEEAVDESRRSYVGASPLPLNNYNNQVNRQGRLFQGQQPNARFVVAPQQQQHQVNRRYTQQQQQQKGGQYVIRGN